MLCRRCLLRAHPRAPNLTTTTRTRTLTTTPLLRTTAPQKPISPNATTAAGRQGSTASHAPPAATSTSAAQPFSAGAAPGVTKAATIAVTKAATTTTALPLLQSSVPAGTPLKGLNFEKNKSDPLAGEDASYPAWLWGVLRPKEKAGGVGEEDDLYSKSKKQRRLAAKRLRKQHLLHPELSESAVPIYEQSVDLPAGDGTVQGNLAAEAARRQLTKAMREKRRKDIKEANFLKAMG